MIASAAALGPLVSVIVPSRLAPQPGRGGRLFLEDALDSVRRQTGLVRRVQILVGVDAGTPAPVDLALRYQAEFVAGGRNQAAALNAAAARAGGDYLAILEDDDVWDPRFLSTMLALIADTEFISSTQLERDETGAIRRINDFPTPSGWFLRRALFEAVGPFDESFRWHLDNDWLGRLGEVCRSRIHAVEATAPIEPFLAAQVRPWLRHVLDLGRPPPRLVRHGDPVPLITRRVHGGSGMQRIARDALLRQEASAEIERIQRRYGRVPW